MDDREWLEAAILGYMAAQIGVRIGVSEEDVVGAFAPTYEMGRISWIERRPSFGNRERKVQKAMTVAAFRRLIANSRIGLVKTYETRKRIRKGKYESITVTLYKPISVLDAIAGV